MIILDADYEWSDGFRHGEITNGMMQRRLAVGTGWSDLVFAVRCSYGRVSEDKALGADGFRIGFCSSDGTYWKNDQTLFLGVSKAESAPVGSGDAIGYSYDHARLVKKEGGTRTLIATAPSYADGGGTFLSQYFAIEASDMPKFQWFIVRCVKLTDTTVTVQYANTYHSYAPRPSIDGMKAALDTQDFSQVGLAVIGSSYVPPHYIDFANKTVANLDTLDSVCVGLDHPSLKLQINAVLVADWS